MGTNRPTGRTAGPQTHASEDDAPSAAMGQAAVMASSDVDDEQLIAVQDGPLAGQWFTWPDWQQRLRAARHTYELTGHRSPALDYVPAGYQIPNPALANTRGWVAVHRPAQTHQASQGELTSEVPAHQPASTATASDHASRHVLERERAHADHADRYDNLADDDVCDGDVYDVAG